MLVKWLADQRPIAYFVGGVDSEWHQDRPLCFVPLSKDLRVKGSILSHQSQWDCLPGLFGCCGMYMYSMCQVHLLLCNLLASGSG